MSYEYQLDEKSKKIDEIYDINIKPVLEKKYGNQTTGISKPNRNRRKR